MNLFAACEVRIAENLNTAYILLKGRMESHVSRITKSQCRNISSGPIRVCSYGLPLAPTNNGKLSFWPFYLFILNSSFASKAILAKYFVMYAALSDGILPSS